jgi:hypothetical protein
VRSVWLRNFLPGPPPIAPPRVYRRTFVWPCKTQPPRRAINSEEKAKGKG